jgi:biopolymer transport protein ExbB/TolQ
MVAEIPEALSSLPGFIGELGSIVLWLQAVGIVVVLWIVFEAFAFYYNRKRLKEVYTIKKDMERIEGKIDRILGKKR